MLERVPSARARCEVTCDLIVAKPRGFSSALTLPDASEAASRPRQPSGPGDPAPAWSSGCSACLPDVDTPVGLSLVLCSHLLGPTYSRYLNRHFSCQDPSPKLCASHTLWVFPLERQASHRISVPTARLGPEQSHPFILLVLFTTLDVPRLHPRSPLKAPFPSSQVQSASSFLTSFSVSPARISFVVMTNTALVTSNFNLGSCLSPEPTPPCSAL